MIMILTFSKKMKKDNLILKILQNCQRNYRNLKKKLQTERAFQNKIVQYLDSPLKNFQIAFKHFEIVVHFKKVLEVKIIQRCKRSNKNSQKQTLIKMKH